VFGLCVLVLIPQKTAATTKGTDYLLSKEMSFTVSGGLVRGLRRLELSDRTGVTLIRKGEARAKVGVLVRRTREKRRGQLLLSARQKKRDEKEGKSWILKGGAEGPSFCRNPLIAGGPSEGKSESWVFVAEGPEIPSSTNISGSSSVVQNFLGRSRRDRSKRTNISQSQRA